MLRQRSWQYLPAVALSVTWMASFLGAGGAEAQLPQQASGVVTPVANVLQIMNVLTTPASEVVFSAVSTVLSSRGLEQVVPKTDQDWQRVEANAALLAESGNLLLLGSRVRDNSAWTTMTRDFIEASIVSMNAARAKDVNALYDSFERLNSTCERCHLKYFP